MRNSWTDERLDDGFDRVSAEIALVRGEVAVVRGEVGELRRELHEEIGGLRQELHEEVGGLRREFYSLNRTFNRMGGGIIVALVGVIFTQL